MTPQSPAITVRIVGATDVGLIREHNEDNYTVLNLETGEIDFSQGRELPLPGGGALLVVCDGMGGAAAGEVASHMAVEVIRRELGPKLPPEGPSTGAASTGPSAAADAASASEKSAGSAPKSGENSPTSAAATPATDATPTPAEAATADKDAGPAAAAEAMASAPSPALAQAVGKAAATDAAAESGSASGSARAEATPSSSAPAMLAPSTGPTEPSGPISEALLHNMARKVRLAGQRANQEIYEAACADISKAGMGTTLTVLMLLRSHVIVGQVGDSRAYLCRRGRLTQITHDQSLVNQLLESGQITPEQAKLFEHSNVILQALGVQEDVEVVLSTETVRRGDRLMLCSDGLVGVVSDEEIQEVLTRAEHIDEAVRRLIELARAGGGPDNITVIVAQVDGDAVPAPTDADLAEYRVLYLDGEKPPERRMWGSEYAFMSQTSGSRDVVGGAPATPPVPSRLSIVSMAAVFALLIIGILGGLLYQPRRPSVPTGIGTPQVTPPQPALPPTTTPVPPTVPANPATGLGSAATGTQVAAAVDGGSAAVAVTAATDAGSAPPASPSAAADAGAGASDAAAVAAHEPEDDTRGSEAAEPVENSKPSKHRKRKKKSTEEPSEPASAPAATPTAPSSPGTPATPAATGTSEPADKPSPEKPVPAAEKPAAEKPAAPAVEKPAAPAEKPAAPVEKPAAPVEKPAAPAEKPAPATAPAPTSP